MTQLLELPSLRGVKMNVNNRGEPRILHTTRTQSIQAVLMQITGHEVPEPCDKCQRGLGPFVGCIISEIGGNGACAGCCYNGRAAQCSLRMAREALEADIIDGQGTEKDGEKELVAEEDESEYIEEDEANNGDEHWQNAAFYSSASFSCAEPSSRYSSPMEHDAEYAAQEECGVGETGMGEAGKEEGAVTETATRKREMENARPKKMGYNTHLEPAGLDGLLSSRDTTASKRQAPAWSSELAMRAHPPKRLATAGLSLQHPAPTEESPSVLRPPGPIQQQRPQDTTSGGASVSNSAAGLMPFGMLEAGVFELPKAENRVVARWLRATADILDRKYEKMCDEQL